MSHFARQWRLQPRGQLRDQVHDHLGVNKSTTQFNGTTGSWFPNQVAINARNWSVSSDGSGTALANAASMRADVDALEQRTRRFAIAAIRLTATLRGQPHLADTCRQMARSASSVAANQRAMRRARSMNEFAAKLQIVNEEIDEAASWLEMLEELTRPATQNLLDIKREALELRAMYAKARKTTREKLEKRGK